MRYGSIRYGSWWRIERVQEGCLSVGVHLDTRARRTGRTGRRYGPYIDLHLGLWVLGVGVNPIYSGEYDLSRAYGRGGLRGDDH